MKKTKLFLLHFAGGNKYSFQFLLPLLKQFDVIPLELPGRGKRMSEPLIRDYKTAVDDYYKQIINVLGTDDVDFSLYGHSMGATLGLLVSKKLLEVNRSPKALIVSGSPGPYFEKEVLNRYKLPQKEFIEELKRLGGSRDEFFDNEELFEFFEPILRADFEILEKETIDLENKLNIKIYAVMGSMEREVDQITNWERFTTSKLEYFVFEGDHFFIQQHAESLAKIISDT
jgi:external thioesterase TEII